MTNKRKHNSESIIRDIKRKIRRKFSAAEKIRIIFDIIRGEGNIAEICRREGIAPNLYYRWSKVFMEAGKRRLQGDTRRKANSREVTSIRQENEELKQ